MRTLLVTVGSTKFDKLIETIERDQIKLKGFVDKFDIKKILIQHGRSRAPKMINFDDIKIVDYLEPEEMSNLLCKSTVIISHGGAGTIFEVLRGNKNDLELFLVVENEELMDSHQSELIDSLIDMKCPLKRGDLNDLFSNDFENKFEIISLTEPNYDLITNIIKSHLV